MTNISDKGILRWINRLLNGRYQKLEDLCTGVAYCQLLILLRSDAINLQKVKFNATIDDEYKENFRVLQTGFKRMGIAMQIPIDKLITGRYKENQDFARWFQNFFTTNQELVECDADDENETESQHSRYKTKNLKAITKKPCKKLLQDSKRKNAKQLEEFLEGEIQASTWNVLVETVESLMAEPVEISMEEQSVKDLTTETIPEAHKEPREKLEVLNKCELIPDPNIQHSQSKTLKIPKDMRPSLRRIKNAETQCDYYSNKKFLEDSEALFKAELENNQCEPNFWQKVYECGSIHISMHSSIDNTIFQKFINSIDGSLTEKIDHMRKTGRKTKSNKSNESRQDMQMNSEIGLNSSNNKSLESNKQHMERSSDIIDKETKVNETTDEVAGLLYKCGALEKDIDNYCEKILRINGAWKCLLNNPHYLSESDTAESSPRAIQEQQEDEY